MTEQQVIEIAEKIEAGYMFLEYADWLAICKELLKRAN
jgi:hypothetical protein